MTPEVVVIGAGPGGMATAAALAGMGVSVQVLDEQPAPGGQVYRGVEAVNDRRPDDFTLLGQHYAEGLDLAKRFRASGAVFTPDTSVWEIDVHANDAVTAVRTVHEDATATIEAKYVVLAAGAMERPTPFPGWTLPGVMGVGAAQTLLKDAALLPAGRVVLAGSGPLLYLFAVQLVNAGLEPARILDTAPAMSWQALQALPAAVARSAKDLWQGWRWLSSLGKSGVRMESRISGLRANGNDRLETVSFECEGRWHRDTTDLLLVHDGVIPDTWLAMSIGCEHGWNPAQQCWTPRTNEYGETSCRSVSIVGDAGGIGGRVTADIRGRIAAFDIARKLGHIDDSRADEGIARCRRELAGQTALRRFIDARFPPSPMFLSPPDDGTLVCRCEEVTAGELRSVAALGVVGPNQGKAFTRCGMGPCLGRECAGTVSRIIAEHHNLSMEEVGHYRIRPPVRPLTVGQLADMDIDRDVGETTG